MSSGRIALPHRDEQHCQGPQHRHLGPSEHIGQHASSAEGHLWLIGCSAGYQDLWTSVVAFRTITPLLYFRELYITVYFRFSTPIYHTLLSRAASQALTLPGVALSRDWTRSFREPRGRLTGQHHMDVTWSVPPMLGFSSSHHHGGLLQLGHGPYKHTQGL